MFLILLTPRTLMSTFDLRVKYEYYMVKCLLDLMLSLLDPVLDLVTFHFNTLLSQVLINILLLE